jgi:hypothetical protein
MSSSHIVFKHTMNKELIDHRSRFIYSIIDLSAGIVNNLGV